MEYYIEMNAQSFEEQVFNLVNKERARRNLILLRLNRELSRVARYKSQDMYIKKYFGHDSPTYGSPFDMLIKFGFSYRFAAENIAKGQKTSQSVVTAWMNSEGHRKNILNPAYSEIGVGYANPSGTPYWTQMFIRQ